MKELAARGSFWTIIDTFGAQLLSLLSFMVLARILVPQDYGVVTLAGVFIAIPNVILTEGFSNAIVQKDGDLKESFKSTAFWVNMAVALVLFGITQAGAGYAAAAANTPLLAPVLRWLSLCFLTTALNSIPTGLYQRDFRYSAFALRTLIATTIASLIGIAMAWMGYGLWSLVASTIIQNVVGVIVMWWGIDWRPKFRFSIAAFKEMFHFTSWSIVGGSVRYAAEKIDVLVIGLFLDAASLGFYYLAQRLFTTIHNMAITPVDTPMMPVLSRLQNDRVQFSENYLNGLWTMTALWMPATAGIGMVAPLLIPLVFGAHWVGAVPLIQVMALVCMTYPLARTAPLAMLAIGRADLYARLSGFQLVMNLIAYPIAAHFGILAVGVTSSALGIVMFVVSIVLLRGIVHIRGRDIERFGTVVSSVIAMCVGVGLVGGLMAAPSLTILLVQIAVAIIAYGVCLYLFATRDVARLASTAYSALPARFRPNRSMT